MRLYYLYRPLDNDTFEMSVVSFKPYGARIIGTCYANSIEDARTKFKNIERNCSTRYENVSKIELINI